MYDDALTELNSLPVENREDPAAVEVRLAILVEAKRWKQALVIAKHLRELRPESNAGHIHTAFCLHELGRTEEARDTLLTGPESLHEEGTFHYNLACYECILGNLDVARLHLEKSIKIEKKFREYARRDPDLKALHDKVEG